MKQQTQTPDTTKQSDVLLPDQVEIDWPVLNDETTCLCLTNDGGEILLRIENDKEHDKWQAFFAQELAKRYNERKALLDSQDELLAALLKAKTDIYNIANGINGKRYVLDMISDIDTVTNKIAKK